MKQIPGNLNDVKELILFALSFQPQLLFTAHSSMSRCSILLCRPFDDKKVTNTSGAWDWVGVPQSTLLNGHGYYGDCALLGGANTAIPPKCNVSLQWVPPGRSSVLPFASPENPGMPAASESVAMLLTGMQLLAN